MTNVIQFLAAEEGSNSVLLPATYDIVWSIVVLIVLGALFTYFVLPKFKEVLSEREDRIAGGIQRAEVAQAEAKAALEKYNAQLADARAEAAEIRDEARARGKQIEAEYKAKAIEESNRIIESGEKQLAAQREQVVAELRREMGQNSISLAERLLGEQLSDDVKRSGTIDQFLSGLDTVSATGK
ncbi:F0F1 ATP synthase subunit B [Corynebacterium sp. sy017]|uniref:F0F1 ATP synthase subunit B n=1 Tax=unclassified Corynebacterium TaxID=2624378 RepID=UPI00118497AE|nr:MULTISPECIES: F0F1 ATP synthase subunit B [unclassified Corynebacterium]MBP3089013.1 F0F1 ATP synthase subunit B [Corynebacterium sp. sy017]QDZ42380.1 F0F1 ATP synthase subunit B [Corynebacterium sp. sy039]TSD91335.1 F0F1 ATP synthase subunit B [Corynebacterium sp. SY003]